MSLDRTNKANLKGSVDKLASARVHPCQAKYCPDAESYNLLQRRLINIWLFYLLAATLDEDTKPPPCSSQEHLNRVIDCIISFVSFDIICCKNLLDLPFPEFLSTYNELWSLSLSPRRRSPSCLPANTNCISKQLSKTCCKINHNKPLNDDSDHRDIFYVLMNIPTIRTTCLQKFYILLCRFGP